MNIFGMPIETQCDDDIELLVYSSLELVFEVDFHFSEQEFLVTNYSDDPYFITSKFFTNQVTHILEGFQSAITKHDTLQMSSSYMKLTKIAPDLWEVLMAGDLQFLTLSIDKINHCLEGSLGKSMNQSPATDQSMQRRWSLSPTIVSLSPLQMTPPESLSEVSGIMETHTSLIIHQKITEIISLSRSKVSFIIGPGGSRIEEIRNISGCEIKVNSLDAQESLTMRSFSECATLQDMLLSGTEEQVAEAKSLIRQVLSGYQRK
ncbi:hypothetical protein CJJ07_000517 [Candidozyma auris]|nr:hypothetical protein CJJ07_000517 [[Candida] auris]